MCVCVSGCVCVCVCVYLGVSVRLQTANEDGRCVDDTSRHIVSWIRINTFQQRETKPSQREGGREGEGERKGGTEEEDTHTHHISLSVIKCSLSSSSDVSSHSTYL